MKRCSKCKKELDFSEFSKRKTGSYSCYCKNCSNIAAKAAYRNNPDKVKKQTQKSLLVLKEITNNIKSKYGCCYCNEKVACCLDFHHLNENEKLLDVSNLIRRKLKLETFNEINKCIVVCSNCHRKIHAGILSTEGKPLCKEKYEDYFEKVGDRYVLNMELRIKYIKSRANISGKYCECGKIKSRCAIRCFDCYKNKRYSK